MKLQPDRSAAPTITAHGPGWVAVDGERVEGSVIVNASGPRAPWPVAHFDALGAESFAALAELGAEIVIFGSGPKLRFPKPAWLAPLAARRIGLETMDTPAACRTYNILAQEGRRVACALILSKEA